MAWKNQFGEAPFPVGHFNPEFACEYTADELEFMKAMERYKREHRRPFPTWHEALGVLLQLGYRKAAPESDPPTAA